MIRMILGRELSRQPFFLSAAASSSHRSLTGLADFFEEGRDPKGDQNVTYGILLLLKSSHLLCLFVGVRWGFCELCSLFCLCRIDESVSLGFLLDIPGRSWKASELRNKSWEDLHQLWYVMLKEKNLLLSQRQMLLSQNYRMPNPERVPKVNLLLLLSSPQVCFFM